MSKGKEKTAVEELAEILADFGSGSVLISPSDLDREAALATVTSMPMDEIIRQFAIMAAQQVANRLEIVPLRPANYADPIVAETVLTLLKKQLSGEDGQDYFTKVFLDQLRSRG